jgi:hypothetical protein
VTARGPRKPPDADDVYLNGFGKVLSIGTRGDEDRIIGMVPGPWEAHFGLPARPWPPAVQSRLAAVLQDDGRGSYARPGP